MEKKSWEHSFELGRFSKEPAGNQEEIFNRTLEILREKCPSLADILANLKPDKKEKLDALLNREGMNWSSFKVSGEEKETQEKIEQIETALEKWLEEENKESKQALINALE